MSRGHSGNYLLAYDIREPKRLARVHRYLRRHAVPVQYSVFVARLTGRELTRIAGDLGALIDAREDDVRIYPLPAACETQLLGPDPWPRGVILASGHALPVVSGRARAEATR